MNAIFKFILISAFFVTMGALLNGTIFDTAIQPMNAAIIYFLVSMAPMKFILTDNGLIAFYNCIEIVIYFVIASSTFILVRWITHIYSK